MQRLKAGIVLKQQKGSSRYYNSKDNMANICVFCGARNGVSQKYIDTAFEFGKLLAMGKHRLIYWWWVFWIMWSTMRWAVSRWWDVLWIIPSFLMNKERADEIAEVGYELIITESMDERKKILFARSDVIVILPGWIGTMDEFFEAITLKQLKQIDWY